MIQICAWCGRFLGLKAPMDRMDLSHGICHICSVRLNWIDSQGLTRREVPHLIVGRSRKDLLPLFEDLLKAVPEIHTIIDRRVGERRREAKSGPFQNRRGRERRQGVTLVLV